MSPGWVATLTGMIERGTATTATIDGALRWARITPAEHGQLTDALTAATTNNLVTTTEGGEAGA